MNLKVSSEEVNTRLDVYLCSKLEDKTRSYVQNLIDEGKVLVNSKTSKSSYKVRLDDDVEVQELETKRLDLVPKDIDIDIIYQDDDLLVINKPRGLVVHPSNGHYDGNTLVNALLYKIDNLSSINGVIRPGIVHRIDKDTSGLLVVAKNDFTHVELQEQLKDHSMHREYYALCEGVIPHEDIKIDAPIGRDPKDRLKRAVDIYNGKEAVTHVHVVERFKNHTLVQCRLETGRTHQIRVHMAYIKFPLVGDVTYGRRKQAIPCNGQMLHAYKISFVHPRTKEQMSFEIDLDQEFKRVLEIVKELDYEGR